MKEQCEHKKKRNLTEGQVRFPPVHSDLESSSPFMLLTLVVSFSEYQQLIVPLMEQAVQKYYGKKTQDVWIYPIKKAEHSGTIKSSDLVAYLCKAVQLQHSDILYKRKLVSTITFLIRLHILKMRWIDG